jgi:tRNA (mo5U34)-methyltransferase
VDDDRTGFREVVLVTDQILMKRLGAPMQEKRLKLGGMHIGVGVDDRLSSRIRTSRTYQLLRPAINRMRGRTNGRAGWSVDREPKTLPIQEVIQEQPRLDLKAFDSEEARDLASRVNEISWYHVIDLPHSVTTPGRVDHRADVGHYGLPADMSGVRVLEVATFDGFWAFEFERRGADVVATDLASFSQIDLPRRVREQLPPDSDEPTGAGFRLAHAALRSRVERREISVYDLSPSTVGMFDLVFMSDLLIHLRDPQAALESIYSIVRPGGQLLVAEVFDPELERRSGKALTELKRFERYVWWTPSTAALHAMLNVAGFNRVEEVSRPMLKLYGAYHMHKVVLRAHPWAAEDGVEATRV